MNRRDFLRNTSVTVSAAALLGRTERIFAAGSQKIKVALIGCGGRGKGALKDLKDAAAHLGIQVEVTALADFFMSRAQEAAQKFGVSPELCLEGPDAYKKAIASGPDVVLLVTPPNFRPLHFEAAVNAGKHVFLEKPVAVDPVGARKVMEVGEVARQKKLVVVAGTQRRHQDTYLRTFHAIQNNAIGPIRGGAVYWCGGALWKKDRQPGESDAAYMVRNWVSFAEMSGDHIVEQHVHNIDVANWFIGRTPEAAIGFGGRARRKTGNQFDFFSVDFDYGDGVHIHSMCRQIDGTYGRVSEFFTGADGATWGSGPGKGSGKEGFARQVNVPEIAYVGNPYVQEHVDLLDSIVNGKPLNEAQAVATSTLTGIMGRIAAYTGQLVRWKDLMDPAGGSPWYALELKPSAADFETASVKAPADEIAPVPGKEPKA
ncbi:MAG: Gfo/Idh/MocA family oxidoreductase [Planctomycetaceae bacterium]|nr:Gfo/Idh/MocA family oxidoreductase [Planctomycetaceae bacterium]